MSGILLGCQEMGLPSKCWRPRADTNTALKISAFVSFPRQAEGTNLAIGSSFNKFLVQAGGEPANRLALESRSLVSSLPCCRVGGFVLAVLLPELLSRSSLVEQLQLLLGVLLFRRHKPKSESPAPERWHHRCWVSVLSGSRMLTFSQTQEVSALSSAMLRKHLGCSAGLGSGVGGGPCALTCGDFFCMLCKGGREMQDRGLNGGGSVAVSLGGAREAGQSRTFRDRRIQPGSQARGSSWQVGTPLCPPSSSSSSSFSSFSSTLLHTQVAVITSED